MSKAHAAVLSCDDNVSYLSAMTKLYERNEQFLMSETDSENRTKIDTIDEITRHR